MKKEKEQLTVLGCDCDNTLFFHDARGFRKKDADAIEKFQKQGGVFGVVTGRSPKRGVTELTEGEYPIRPDYYVYSNGACLMDGDGTILQESFMPEEAVRALYDRWKHRQVGFQTPEGNCTTVERKGTHWKQVYSADDFDMSRVFNVFFWMEDPEESDEIEAFAATLEGVTSARNTETIDVYGTANSKATGLRYFASKFAREKDRPVRIVALGDSGNDEPMIMDADLGATFASCPENLRNKADLIVDGAWELIGHLNEE